MKSCNIASAEFIEQVEAIVPSIDINQFYTPCSVVLNDGTRLERVICVEEHRAFESEGWIHPDRVKTIEASPLRMPPLFASELYEAGESGDGYEIFRLQMKSGETFVFKTENVVDFPALPDGFTAEDIHSVLPHSGREVPEDQHLQSAPYLWCFYVKS